MQEVTPDGVSCKYLSQIPLESLLGLDTMIDSIKVRSPFLANWLSVVVMDEMEKQRGLLDTSITTPHEAARTNFPIAIPPGDLAGVLEALHLASYVVSCPYVASWIDELAMLAVAQSALSLRDYQRLIDRLEEIT